MEEEIIGICGLSCSKCPGYIATQNDDDTQREKVARDWSRMFNRNLVKEDINCDGCRSQSGRLFSHCYVCEIRKCGIARNVKNCAYCNDYPCQKLNDFFKEVPEAKLNLESIKRNM